MLYLRPMNDDKTCLLMHVRTYDIPTTYKLLE